jgi:DNA-binding beta-propeller fold protein YncE
MVQGSITVRKIKTQLRSIGTAVGVVVLTLISLAGADGWAGDNGNDGRADSLYVGDTTSDASADTVKRFDAITGKYQGVFVQPAAGGLQGPRGLVFNYRGDLLVSNQNVFLDISGDVLRFDGRSGAFKNELVASGDPNAPFAPQGIALSEDGRYLFVTDLGGGPATPPPGALKEFTAYGGFVANLTPPPDKLATDSYHPRAIVIGPDRRLYVSNMPIFGGIGGQVLRFDQKTGKFIDGFINDAGGVGHLNRPQGLVFGPDGNLYVTSFRDNSQPNAPGNTDAIRIYNGKTGRFLGSIDLDNPPSSGVRAFAQALLFGPRGKLFVPISGNGPQTGEVRRYDVRTKLFDVFVPASANGGPLGAPWFLTFGKTDAATLAYHDNN